MPFGKEGATDEMPAGEPNEAAPLVSRIEEEIDLLARNVEILEKLSKSPPLGIIRLSEALHLPIHKTRYSLHLLEREGVIQPSADGAVVTDKAKEFWSNLGTSVDRMSAVLQRLKARAAERENRSPPGRKGY